MSTETLLRGGRTAEAKLDRNEAIAQFEQAFQADPANAEVCFKLGYHLDLVGEESRAIGLFERSSSGERPHLNALINLAVLYEDEGQYVKAERCLRMVIDTDPNHRRARLFMKDVRASRAMYADERSVAIGSGDGTDDTPISDFDLSTRARTCLKKMNIRTLNDLLRISEAELTAYKNFGEATLLEIKSLLEQRGLRLGQALDQRHSAARDEVYDEIANVSGEQAVGVLNQSVDDLNLSVRARKALGLLGIATIGDLVARTEAELLGIKNFGATSMDEIKAKLQERGLSLRKYTGESDLAE